LSPAATITGNGWANRTARSRFHVISAKHGETQRKFKTKTKNEKPRIAPNFA